MRIRPDCSLFRWRRFVPGFWISFFFRGKELRDEIANFYGYKSYMDFKPERRETIKQLDLLEMISADDPPVWVKNTQKGGIPKNKKELYHHPSHAVALKKMMIREGVKSFVYTSKERNKRNVNISLMEFFKRHLNN